MIVRREQMAILEEAQWRRFEIDVITRLRETLGCDWDEPRLSSFIRDCVARAQKYQIETEYDCRRFIEYAMEFGDAFEALPWIASVLRATSLSGEDKMDRIDAISTFTMR